MSDQWDVFYIQSKLAIVEAFDQAVQTTPRAPQFHRIASDVIESTQSQRRPRRLLSPIPTQRQRVGLKVVRM